MLLSLFKDALDWLEVCTEEELREKYKEEDQWINTVVPNPDEDPEKEPEIFELDALLQKLDEPPAVEEPKLIHSSGLSFKVEELIAKIDAKIAELEREEKKKQDAQEPANAAQMLTSEEEMIPQIYKEIAEQKKSEPFSWISELAPKKDSSPKYCFAYIKTVLYYLVNTEESIMPNAILGRRVKETINNLQNDSLRFICLSLCDMVVGLRSDEEQRIEAYASRIKLLIQKKMHKFTEEIHFTLDDLEQVRFYRDILFLILSISKHTANRNHGLNQEEARAYIFYYLADNFYGKKESSPAEGLRYAKQGLALTDPLDRQDSFNTLGLCAVDTRGNKQLAYDAYYSWIYQKPVGLIVRLLPDGFSFGSEEDIWRQQKIGKSRTSLMHSNFSYTCGVIAYTYEPYTTRWQIFTDKAVKQIKKAIDMRTNLEQENCLQDSNNFCTYGTLLSQLNKPNSSYQDCFVQYQKYYESAKNKSDQLSAARHRCETMLDELLSRLLNGLAENGRRGVFHSWVSEQKIKAMYDKFMDLLKDYRRILDDAKDDPSVDEDEKQAALEPFFELHDKFMEEDWELQFALLMIWHLAHTIKTYLKRYEYSSTNYFTRIVEEDAGVSPERPNVQPIAYYTTLKTATYLFNVLYRDSKHTAPYLVKPDQNPQYKDGINCLTMMHAHYMNDTYEGLALADCVSGINQYSNILFYRGDATRFREDIYERYFVFLKSFTDRIDDLLMWNRYSSDRNLGSKDSNGCCVQFNADFFDKVNNSDNSAKNKLLLDDADDYALYRVVYVSKDGTIQEEKNQGLSECVKPCYDMLIKLLREVNDYLCKWCTPEKEDEQVGWIRSFVQAALRNVIFLFKNDDYADESEYRLIATRTHKQLDCIRMISGEPDKVSINPYFQVCIDKVILGPNVTNTESWITYFRYHLSRMWQRASGPVDERKLPEFSIEKSKIHYHT